ncbi:hypothetical protein H4219_006387 [Mycoemilia scoparia]|uniref:Uncharacterized protein n=1 Tax=Mycoemilia scoparia TaxID=417184 RepID=A0A9W7ZK28_9FUNG|nr:hypothetical protein H4219_006387 [Mycoemilia scoparia]
MRFKDFSTQVTCIIVPIKEDLILGMSWFTDNNVTIQCNPPRVTVKDDDGSQQTIKALELKKKSSSNYKIAEITEMNQILQDPDMYTRAGLVWVKPEEDTVQVRVERI